jgi:opacity protein-like surface antigen
MFIVKSGFAQVANTSVMDTTDFRYQGKVTVEGYLDLYYAYDFNKPEKNIRPYFVSMNRHNEVSLNVAFIDLKYSSARLRARFVPAFGSYMNSNYALEEGTFKNIVEASAGVKISKQKNIWIDAGIFGSPYTNESAISKDHLTYTRSFAPEYVPYYLAGIKLSLPLSDKVNAYLYLLNGWQQINDQNKNKSVGTQLEYRPSEHWLINWNTYAGKESSASDTTIGMRVFSDVYFIYSKNKWSSTFCVYGGSQEQKERTATWWQANIIARYQFADKFFLSGRLEYFNDVHAVQIVPITSSESFNSFGVSMGVDYKLAENILIRLEGRTFASTKDVYLRNNVEVSNSSLLTSNITIWF